MSELTREQVEYICKFLVEEHLSKDASTILDHDAALRRILAQQAQEVERLRREKNDAVIELYRKLDAKDDQLAAMTTARDVWQRQHETVEQENKNFRRINDELQATLAAREGVIEHWEASQAAMRKERQEAIEYLERLFFSMAPQCVSLGNLLGVCTQVDNAICGLKKQRDAAVHRAEQAEARVQASYDADMEHWSKRPSLHTLTWTKEKPTVEGLYLWRYGDGAPLDAIQVSNIDYIAGGGEWAGPIPLPEAD